MTRQRAGRQRQRAGIPDGSRKATARAREPPNAPGENPLEDQRPRRGGGASGRLRPPPCLHHENNGTSSDWSDPTNWHSSQPTRCTPASSRSPSPRHDRRRPFQLHASRVLLLDRASLARCFHSGSGIRRERNTVLCGYGPLAHEFSIPTTYSGCGASEAPLGIAGDHRLEPSADAWYSSSAQRGFVARRYSFNLDHSFSIGFRRHSVRGAPATSHPAAAEPAPQIATCEHAFASSTILVHSDHDSRLVRAASPPE
jgi:hypothetical protein